MKAKLSLSLLAMFTTCAVSASNVGVQKFGHGFVGGTVGPEARLTACLQVIRPTIAVIRQTNRFGIKDLGDPTPSLPNLSAICRAHAVERVFTQTKFGASPPLPVLRTDLNGEPSERRTYLWTSFRILASWIDFLGNERRILERLDDVQKAGEELKTKISVIQKDPKAAWPNLISWGSLNYPACRAISQWSARDSAFAMYPEYRRFAFSVVVADTSIVPIGTERCEPFTVAENTGISSDISCKDTGSSGGSGCSSDLQGSLSPFFTEQAVLVKDRRSKSVDPYLEDFVNAVTKTVASASEARKRLTIDRSAAVTRVTPSEEALGRHIEIEKTWLDAKAASIAKIQSEQTTLKALIESDRANHIAWSKLIAQYVRLIEDTKHNMDLNKVDIDKSMQRENDLRDQMGELTKSRSEIKLKCDGYSYAKCTSGSARQAYDEAVYRANERYLKVSDQWLKAIEASAELWKQAAALATVEVGLRKTLSETKSKLSKSQIVLPLRERSYASIQADLDQEIRYFEGIRRDHLTDVGVLARLREELAK